MVNNEINGNETGAVDWEQLREEDPLEYFMLKADSLEAQLKHQQGLMAWIMNVVEGLFARERGEDGELLRPDYVKLISIMQDLVETGQALSLEQAHEVAKRIDGSEEG